MLGMQRREASWGAMAFLCGLVAAMALLAPAQGEMAPQQSLRGPDLVVRVVNNATYALDAHVTIRENGQRILDAPVGPAPRDRADAAFLLPRVGVYTVVLEWTLRTDDGGERRMRHDLMISTANCDGTDLVVFAIDGKPDPNRRDVIDVPDVRAGCA